MIPYPDLIKELRLEARDLPLKFSQNDELFQTLMDAADAIEKLITERNRAYTKLCLWCGICEHPTPMDLDTCELAAIGQEYQPTEEERMIYKDAWIKCSEALPEADVEIEYIDNGLLRSRKMSKNVSVGIQEKNGTKLLGCGSYVRQDDGRGWWEGFDENGRDLRNLNVVVWQPFHQLPDPPLKEET